MRAITDGRQTYSTFLDRIETQLHGLVDQGRALGRIAVDGAATKANGGAGHGPAGKGGRKPTARRRS